MLDYWLVRQKLQHGQFKSRWRSNNMFRASKLQVVIIGSCLLVAPKLVAAATIPDEDSWTADFDLDKKEFASSGRNPYFILEPGYELILEDRDNRLVITVLNETKMV